MIFGGIYGGVFTPTEAAGVAVVYSIFVTMVIYREVDIFRFWKILVDSAFLISQILLIVTSAGIYSWLLTTSGIPQQIVAAIDALHLAKWELLLILNVGLLDRRKLSRAAAAILILTPLLLPIVEAVGVNAIHFGIIVTVNLSLGMYTPPFGLNLFSSQAIFNAPLSRIYRGVLPFLVLNFVALLIITYIPEISMVLLHHDFSVVSRQTSRSGSLRGKLFLMTNAVLGIIGGSGIYDLPGLEKVRSKTIRSPWGAPSGPLRIGEIAGLPVVFLSRHGPGHRLSPSDINYRANIDVLKRAGVTDLVSLSACGSFRRPAARHVRPGRSVRRPHLQARELVFRQGLRRACLDGASGVAAVAHPHRAKPRWPRTSAWCATALMSASRARNSRRWPKSLT